MSNAPSRLPTLLAAIDRVIPADDYPSASQANVDRFILALLGGDRKGDAATFDAGLLSLDAEARALGEKSFADSSTAIQDQILERTERGEAAVQWTSSPASFFELLLNLVAEGYFSDPGNGANKDAVSWSMIGYDPGANRP